MMYLRARNCQYMVSFSFEHLQIKTVNPRSKLHEYLWVFFLNFVCLLSIYDYIAHIYYIYYIYILYYIAHLSS